MPRHVVSASRRTDIPAFHTPWFLRRVREGFVLVRNPRNPQHVFRVSLRAEDVAAVVFWSRDYGRLLRRLEEIDGHGLRPYFHFTLTGYGRPLELRCPAVPEALRQLELLAARYGRERVVWRYDPIVIGSEHRAAWHAGQFENLASRIAPLAGSCVVSYLDEYASAMRGLGSAGLAAGEQFTPAPPPAERLALAHDLAAIGRAHGLRVSACCEPDLVLGGLARARCIDPDLVRTIAGDPDLPLRDAPTRRGCGCVQARDVGAYQTCAHGCVYCYANDSPERGLSGARAVRSGANHLGSGDIAEAKPPPRSGGRQLPLLRG